MVSMNQVRTAREALEFRGVDTSAIKEGQGALDWLVHDKGQELEAEPYSFMSPACVLSFARVGMTGRNRDEPYRMNSGIALDPSHTKVMWLG